MASKDDFVMEVIKGFKDERILSETEVKKITQLLRDLVRQEFPDLPEKAVQRTEEIVRMHSLRKRFQSAREARALTIKQVAAHLKVPQYRLKAIEEASLSEIKQDIFQKYSEFLELEDWVSEWADANKKLATKLGLKV
jgi:ribosome-binding protein aMBF1 (putative translation factor)